MAEVQLRLPGDRFRFNLSDKATATMKLCDGTDLLLGDRISLGTGVTGVIVIVFDKAQYSENYPESEWAYLAQGILVESPEMGLVYFTEADENMALLGRKNDASG